MLAVLANKTSAIIQFQAYTIFVLQSPEERVADVLLMLMLLQWLLRLPRYCGHHHHYHSLPVQFLLQFVCHVKCYYMTVSWVTMFSTFLELSHMLVVFPKFLQHLYWHCFQPLLRLCFQFLLLLRLQANKVDLLKTVLIGHVGDTIPCLSEKLHCF